jgi:hypothetical protein
VRLLADESASDAKWSLPQRQLPATQKWIFASLSETSTVLITSDVAHLSTACAVAARPWAALAAFNMCFCVYRQTANTSSQPCLAPTTCRSAHRALPDACAVCRHSLSDTHTFPQDGKVLSIESVYLKNTAWTSMYFVVFCHQKVVLSPGHSPHGTYLRNDLYICVISTTNHS